MFTDAGLHAGDVLGNICVARCYNTDMQERLINDLSKARLGSSGLSARSSLLIRPTVVQMMVEDSFSLLVPLAASPAPCPRDASVRASRLLRHCCQIIDSVTALFRNDFTGRGELADRSWLLLRALWNQLLSVACPFCRQHKLGLHLNKYTRHRRRR